MNKEMIEEYLYYVFGVKFKYNGSDEYHGRLSFKYKNNIIFYYNSFEEYLFGYNVEFYENEEFMTLFRKLDDIDIKVWTRKIKLERVGNGLG
jgi:hypothetical protein